MSVNGTVNGQGDDEQGDDGQGDDGQGDDGQGDDGQGDDGQGDDGQGDDTPSNRPPVFHSTRYVFDLKEGRDGRSTPVSLGTVEAVDPEGGGCGTSCRRATGRGLPWTQAAGPSPTSDAGRISRQDPDATNWVSGPSTARAPRPTRRSRCG